MLVFSHNRRQQIMSLNQFKLPHFLVEELYKDALLTPPGKPSARTPSSTDSAPFAPAPASPAAPPAQVPTPAASPSPAPPGYKFLGNNRRKITLLVNSPGSVFLPDEHLTFLTKILAACRMTLADVAIVNQATEPVAVAALRQQLSPTTILLFGLEPTAIRLPINFPFFKIQPYDQCTYLSVPALDQLTSETEESKLLKSKLWVCLKTLFDV